MDGTYEKGGSAGSKGVDFQVGLLEVFLLNALKRLKDWRLSTENKKAGKFDDVVLELDDSSAVLLQAKFKENTKKNKVTLNQLLSIDSKHDDFSVPKYYFSYEEVKKAFLVKNIIICTNAGVDRTALPFLKSRRICPDSMLHYGNDNCLFYTFNEEMLPLLKHHVQNYHKNNLKGKAIHETIISDENLKDYLRNLQLFFNYSPENNLEKVTEQLLLDLKRSNDLWEKASPQDIHSKIKDWFQQSRGEYLTENRAKAMLCEIRSDKYCQMLENYNLNFVNNNFTFAGSKKLFHVVVEGGYLLKVAKIHQALKNTKTKVLYVDPEDNADLHRHAIDTFNLPPYVFLVIIRPKFVEETVVKEMGDKLRKILETYSYKKLVLVEENESNLLRLIGFNTETYDVVKESITFVDLSNDVQKKLLEKKNISLQEFNISLKKLLHTQSTEDYNENIHSQLLDRVIRDEKIQIGQPLLDLTGNMSRYYIKRAFQRKIHSRGEGKSMELFSERDIYKVDEKLIFLADSAGTGKSTVLTNLAVGIKKAHPYLWVVKIEVNCFTKFLSDCLRNNKETVNIIELLNSKDTTKLKNDLEKFVFSLRAKVVLLLDGFDEVSPCCTKLALRLLEECKEATNFDKVFVTTRPHMIPMLDAYFYADPFTLQPFTEENQIDFLKTYWTDNLKLNRKDIKKCEQYARTLVSQMWMYLDDDTESSFTSVPLHLRMLAECFQENSGLEGPSNWKGCKEYLVAKEEELKLPERMNITELYKTFIAKKRDLFLDKQNPTGNDMVNQALGDVFDNCLAHHRTLALQVMLDRTEFELLPTGQEDQRNTEANVLMMGIMQKSGKNFHFVHKTFAEYFFAESLLAELQKPNRNLEFQKFFIDKVLMCAEFKVTRTFLDWFLHHAVDCLPSDVFHTYQSYEEDIDLREACDCSLIHSLAKEGCVAILQLIFRSVGFKVITDAEVHIADLYDVYSSSSTKYVKGKTLTSIKLLLDRGGVNIKDEIGWTPLHYAVQRLQMEMVEFLIEQGADINNADKEGRTPLHVSSSYHCHSLLKSEGLIKRVIKKFIPVGQRDVKSKDAADFRNFDIMALLLNRGADLTTKDKDGRDALSMAIHAKNEDNASFLFGKLSGVTDLDLKEALPDYMAASGENGLDALKGQMERRLNVLNGGCDEEEETVINCVSVKNRVRTGFVCRYFCLRCT